MYFLQDIFEKNYFYSLLLNLFVSTFLEYYNIQVQ